MDQMVYIDGDILPYKVGFVTQRVIYILDKVGLHSCSPLLVTKEKRKVTKFLMVDPSLIVTELFFTEQPFQAINTLKLAIQGIVKGSGASRFTVVLSGDTNFRDRVATIKPYKGNREGVDKPFYWKMLRAWLAEKPYTVITEDEEADDLLSRAMMDGHIGATIDKDLNNTPGWHYNFDKKEKYYVDEDEALLNFYTQMLTGDNADNIPGIRGIGPVTAAKLLAPAKNPKEMEGVVYQQYKKVYDNPLAALTEVGQLLWMRREEGEMWEMYK